MCFLRHELGFGKQEKKAGTYEGVNIVVLQADGQPFGLVVDEVIDTEEIVVKPLGKRLKSVGIYAGATIMGDGKVALILDVMGLAQRASVVSEMHERTGLEAADTKQEAEGAASTRQTLLLLEFADGGRTAIPLSAVARLEEFARNTIEQVGEQRVLQYRGEILPLLDVCETLAGAESRSFNGFRQSIRNCASGGDQFEGAASRVRCGAHPGRSRNGRLARSEKLPHGSRGQTRYARARDGNRRCRAAGDHGGQAAACAGCLTDAEHRSHREHATELVEALWRRHTILHVLSGRAAVWNRCTARAGSDPLPGMTHVPLMPEELCGLINLRGQIVPALDLRKLLSLGERKQGELPVNVVVRGDDGAMSFLVDEIGDVLDADEKSFEHAPETLKGMARELWKACTS